MNTLRDMSHRFLIETAGVRGQLVHLDDCWQEVLLRADYPPPVRPVLGEACAASALLASTLKFDGRLSLQLRGAGPVHLLIAQTTSECGVRGLARWEGSIPGGGIDALFAQASLTLSIENGQGHPYSGTVGITGARLQDAVEAYFASSDQIPTRLWLVATDRMAAGLLLQRLPTPSPSVDEDWRRVCLLAATLAPAELLELPATTLIRRVFHEEDVRLFRPRELKFQCTCSNDRCAGMLRQLGQDEIQDLLREQQRITVTCEFCGYGYQFDAVDCQRILDSGSYDDVSETRH